MFASVEAPFVAEYRHFGPHNIEKEFLKCEVKKSMAASKECIARAKRVAGADTTLSREGPVVPTQDKTAKVANFLKRFHCDRDIDVVFTSGCCYWFAVILHQRFPHSRIMYDVIGNHFVTEIGGRLYDVTGDVTGKYDVIPWDTFKNTDHGTKIIRDCVNF